MVTEKLSFYIHRWLCDDSPINLGECSSVRRKDGMIRSCGAKDDQTALLNMA